MGISHACWRRRQPRCHPLSPAAAGEAGRLLQGPGHGAWRHTSPAAAIPRALVSAQHTEGGTSFGAPRLPLVARLSLNAPPPTPPPCPHCRGRQRGKLPNAAAATVGRRQQLLPLCSVDGGGWWATPYRVGGRGADTAGPVLAGTAGRRKLAEGGGFLLPPGRRCLCCCCQCCPRPALLERRSMQLPQSSHPLSFSDVPGQAWTWSAVTLAPPTATLHLPQGGSRL